MKEENCPVLPRGPVGDVREWCLHQLELAIKKLTECMSVIAYARNPESLDAAAKQCDELQAVLTACEFQLLYHSAGEQDYREALSALLMLDAHQLLADARSMIRVPLRPVRRQSGYGSDNVIELKPAYSDLTDAAFERMLASSDIPQFLSTPAHWQDEQQDATSGPGRKLPVRRNQSKLKLVYSRTDK